MPRRMDADTTVLYRAVIETVYEPDGVLRAERVVYTTYAGPFLSQGAATAAIGRARPRFWEPPGSYASTGHVEITELDWRPLNA